MNPLKKVIRTSRAESGVGAPGFGIPLSSSMLADSSYSSLFDIVLFAVLFGAQISGFLHV